MVKKSNPVSRRRDETGRSGFAARTTGFPSDQAGTFTINSAWWPAFAVDLNDVDLRWLG